MLKPLVRKMRNCLIVPFAIKPFTKMTAHKMMKICDDCLKTHKQCAVCQDYEPYNEMTSCFVCGQNYCGACDKYDLCEEYNAETFGAYDVASWNPADEPSEEEAVWEQFYEYCPDMELTAKLWDLEGQPGDSAESWMDSLEGTDEHENVFERHYQLIKEAAYRWWSKMYDAEEKTRTTIYFPDGSTMRTYTDYTIEEHRELAKPHNEHYDYLKYLETTSDSRIKTFKEWLMYENLPRL